MKKTSKLLTLAFAVLCASTLLAEDPSCSVCLDDYTHNTIVIQLDCNEPVNHHVCLKCANQLNDRHQSCPVCRAPFRVHNPRLGAGYSKIHHLYRDLTSSEQAQLKKLLDNAPISDRPAPDAIDITCRACNTEHDSEILIRFTCTHAFCLPEALKLAQSSTTQCPTCNNQLRLVDPLKTENGHIELVYQNRIATSLERPSLEKLRSYRHLPVYQDHIPVGKRIPVVKAQEERPSRPAPNIPRPEELPEVAKLFPDVPLTAENIRLTNTYLPAHLSPTIWQVVVMPDGTYAQARRARELPQWPPYNKTQPSLVETLGRHATAGLLLGLLAGPEFDKGSSLQRRILYIPALAYSLFGLYDCYSKDPNQALVNTGKWGAGLVAGIVGYSWKAKTEKE